MRERSYDPPVLAWAVTLSVLAGALLAVTPQGAVLYGSLDLHPVVVAVLETPVVTVASGTDVMFSCFGGDCLPLWRGWTWTATVGDLLAPAALLAVVVALKVLLGDLRQQFGADDGLPGTVDSRTSRTTRPR